MTILIIAIVLVLLGLWYSGLYYNCGYFKSERLKMFVQLKELLNRRCDLMTDLGQSVKRPDLVELCEKALAEADIDKRIEIECEISAIFKEFDYDNNIVVSEALYSVEDKLRVGANSFNDATDRYNVAVSNGLIKMTARIADLAPAPSLYIF